MEKQEHGLACIMRITRALISIRQNAKSNDSGQVLKKLFFLRFFSILKIFLVAKVFASIFVKRDINDFCIKNR